MKGVGPAGGGGVSVVHESFVEGTVDLNGIRMKFFGAGNVINPSTAAYIVFEQKFPAHLAFGYVDKPDGIPALWQPFSPSRPGAACNDGGTLGSISPPFGLTPLGRSVIQEMMKRRMIIDVDHMSERSHIDTVAESAKSFNYPLAWIPTVKVSLT